MRRCDGLCGVGKVGAWWLCGFDIRYAYSRVADCLPNRVNLGKVVYVRKLGVVQFVKTASPPTREAVFAHHVEV